MTTLKANLTRHCVRKHCIYENPEDINDKNEVSTDKEKDTNDKKPGENVNIEENNDKIELTPFQCKICSKTLKNDRNLKYHVNICKGVLNSLECYHCHRVFNSHSAKSYHIKSCTPPPPPPPVPPPPVPYKKKQIPQSVRIAVWDTYIGRAVGETNCTVCNTAKISQFNFHCGHIIAERNGGDISIENLRPICKSCNSSMRTTNLEEYKQQYFK